MGATTFALLRRRQAEQETEASTPSAPSAEWYATLTASEALDAVEAGEITLEDAVRYERRRSYPRKTVLSTLDPDS